MSKKAYISFSLDHQARQKEDNILTNFLNDKYTGQIVDIYKDFRESSDQLRYYVIYEKLTDEDLEEPKYINRNITKLNKSKSKPKLL